MKTSELYLAQIPYCFGLWMQLAIKSLKKREVTWTFKSPMKFIFNWAYEIFSANLNFQPLKQNVSCKLFLIKNLGSPIETLLLYSRGFLTSNKWEQRIRYISTHHEYLLDLKGLIPLISLPYFLPILRIGIIFHVNCEVVCGVGSDMGQNQSGFVLKYGAEAIGNWATYYFSDIVQINQFFWIELCL